MAEASAGLIRVGRPTAGRRFDDAIVGQQGNDVMRPLGGHDLVFGGQGNDTIYARDGQRDTINCGPGHDVVYADKFDVAKECERILRAGS